MIALSALVTKPMILLFRSIKQVITCLKESNQTEYEVFSIKSQLFPWTFEWFTTLATVFIPGLICKLSNKWLLLQTSDLTNIRVNQLFNNRPRDNSKTCKSAQTFGEKSHLIHTRCMGICLFTCASCRNIW